MTSKAERTSQYILEKVAPVFNKRGYTATSMTQLTEATGLTKGAIYGNFKNKEELALLCFNHNIKMVSDRMRFYTRQVKSPIEKLHALTQFYRNYHDYTATLGGCPILNIGVDAKNNNPQLLKRVQEVINEFQDNLRLLIQKGKDTGEIKPQVDPKKYAYRIFALMEGSIFMAVTMNDRSYLHDMMESLEQMINLELKQ